MIATECGPAAGAKARNQAHVACSSVIEGAGGIGMAGLPEQKAPEQGA